MRTAAGPSRGRPPRPPAGGGAGRAGPPAPPLCAARGGRAGPPGPARGHPQRLRVARRPGGAGGRGPGAGGALPYRLLPSDVEVQGVPVGAPTPVVSNPVYEVIHMDAAGKSRRVFIRKKDLLRTHQLQTRDLRRVDPSLGQAKNSPSLVIRGNGSVLLMNLGGVRTIISKDGAWIFEPEGTAASRFVDIVGPRLQAAHHEPAQDGQAGASYDMDISGPFQLECMEGALMITVGQLEAQLQIVQQQVEKMLTRLPGQINPGNLEELRKVKAGLVELESNTDVLRELLEELLDDNDDIEDIAGFVDFGEESYAGLERAEDAADRGGGPAPGGEAAAGEAPARGGASAALPEGDLWLEVKDEEAMKEREIDLVEDLLEYYYQRCSLTYSEAQRLLSGMRDLEDSVGVVLSSRRYEVNRLELILSMASFAAALGAVVSGIFGMNLRSNLEMSVLGFYLTTFSIVVMCTGAFFFLYFYVKGKKIL